MASTSSTVNLKLGVGESVRSDELLQLGIRSVQLTKNDKNVLLPFVKASLFSYKAIIVNSHSGTFLLTDRTGDDYTLRCVTTDREHSVAFNSKDPTIMKITGHRVVSCCCRQKADNGAFAEHVKRRELTHVRIKSYFDITKIHS